MVMIEEQIYYASLLGDKRVLKYVRAVIKVPLQLVSRVSKSTW